MLCYHEFQISLLDVAVHSHVLLQVSKVVLGKSGQVSALRKKRDGGAEDLRQGIVEKLDMAIEKW